MVSFVSIKQMSILFHRALAVEQRVGWREYWGFLGGFVNLASEEGLATLEKYLKNKTQQVGGFLNRKGEKWGRWV